MVCTEMDYPEQSRWRIVQGANWQSGDTTDITKQDHLPFILPIFSRKLSHSITTWHHTPRVKEKGWKVKITTDLQALGLRLYFFVIGYSDG